MLFLELPAVIGSQESEANLVVNQFGVTPRLTLACPILK
ncbi:hypothetical protein NOVOSPHI9U_260082 [Novosphingobium sp. 9U]|nr:hypothetical protein NOVOSPHI9U_260082 [Novosphingobium sp. 9U]